MKFELSPRASEFVFQMLAQATGAVLAAAVVFLFSTAVGALQDVPLEAILPAVLALVGAVVSTILARQSAQRLAEARAAIPPRLPGYLSAMTPEEREVVWDVIRPRHESPATEEEWRAANEALEAADRRWREDRDVS